MQPPRHALIIELVRDTANLKRHGKTFAKIIEKDRRLHTNNMRKRIHADETSKNPHKCSVGDNCFTVIETRKKKIIKNINKYLNIIKNININGKIEH